MRWVARLERCVPEGYACEFGRPGMVAIAHEVHDALFACGYGLDGPGPLRPSRLGGRRPLWEFEAGGEAFLVRRFSHGGLLRFVTGRRYADPLRPFRELALARALRDWGFATPELVAARALRAPGFGWHLEVVSRRVTDSLDLGAVLAADRRAALSPRVRADLLQRVGATVRALHDRGFLHADLTPRNLLVRRAALQGGDSPLWILDLDGSRVAPAPSAARRADDLRRLARHSERLVRAGRARLGRADWVRLLRGYEPERGARRAWASRVAAGRRRTRAAHATGWALERRFGGREGPA